MADQPGLLQTIKDSIKAPSSVEAKKAVDEEASKKLPKPLMPREGIEEDRRRKAMIDALKDE
jgi:hypothetical protein